MQSPELATLPLPPHLQLLLAQANYLTASELLLTPVPTLSRRLRLPPPAVSQLVADVALLVAGDARTVLDLVQEEEEITITTGDVEIDRLLGGGVRVGSVTEIVGQSASGKSHLCLQLALTVQLPHTLGGLAGGAILISSEGHLPSSRLLSLARSLIARLPSSPPAEEDRKGDHEPRSEWDHLDNIHLSKCPTVEALASLLAFFVPAQIERVAEHARAGTPLPSSSSSSSAGPFDPPSPSPSLPSPTSPLARTPKAPLPIRLLLIDSLAAPFRGDDSVPSSSSSNFIARARDFAVIGDAMKRIASVYRVAVVVVNQVSDVWDRDAPLPPPAPPDPSHPSPAPAAGIPGTFHATPPLLPPHEQYHLPPLLYARYQSPHYSGETPTLRVGAALGHTWANAVNERVMLSFCPLPPSAPSDDGGEGSSLGEEGGYDGVRASRRREMRIVFSPVCARGRVEYDLGEEGLVSVGEATLL